jgi:tRNA (guanine-N7-)-methyltransferase
VKQFPIAWESRRPTYHYPDESQEVIGDVLEIGPGRGDMLLWLAQQQSDKRLVAIELMLGRYRKLIRRIERLGLVNVRLVRGNARILLPKFFKSPSFEMIYVLFPDPWPKERHRFQRLLSVDILMHLSSIMCDGGELVIATDHRPYAEWVVKNLEQVPTLINLGNPFSPDHTLIPNPDRTYFETKWRKKGKDIYFVHAQKSGRS